VGLKACFLRTEAGSYTHSRLWTEPSRDDLGACNGLEPVPFNDGGAVASTDMSTEYSVILLTSEGGTHARCGEGARRILNRLRPD
jgi:hypothetical protein